MLGSVIVLRSERQPQDTAREMAYYDRRVETSSVEKERSRSWRTVDMGDDGEKMASQARQSGEDAAKEEEQAEEAPHGPRDDSS